MRPREVLGLALICSATSLGAPGAASGGERVPSAAVVNGVPQGLFIGRSLLTGRAVCLLFLPAGRITRSIPAGGLENLDWARHQAQHPGDSGTWALTGGQLTITWGDGGVHQGPLVVHPGGIEFYGKRYARPAAVSVAAIAGRWESSRGTAIGGGPGVNTSSLLVVQPGGRFQWTSTTGGVVAGRAASGGMATSGTLAISGATLTFRMDDGTVAAHTFLAVAGDPVDVFSLDQTLFTRLR